MTPRTPDALVIGGGVMPGAGPVIGRLDGYVNLLVALGHHRNGILLAPVTAEAIRARADGVTVPDEVRPFVCG